MCERVKPTPGTAVMDPESPVCFIGCPRQPGRTCTAWTNEESNPRWEFRGTRDAPTLLPSYNCAGGCGWHGYVVDGKLIAAQPGVSVLTLCASCEHPHIVSIGIQPNGRGQIAVDVRVDDARKLAAQPEETSADA